LRSNWSSNSYAALTSSTAICFLFFAKKIVG
jgi:hypothetical protein